MSRGSIIPEGGEAAYARFGFAPAFRAGDTIYVSGVIGRGPDGKVPDDAGDEFVCAFEQLTTVLAAAGATLADIVDLTTFHIDAPATIGPFMSVKARFIAEPFPAWTAIGCSALLAPGARVEIKAIAVASPHE